MQVNDDDNGDEFMIMMTMMIMMVMMIMISSPLVTILEHLRLARLSLMTAGEVHLLLQC